MAKIKTREQIIDGMCHAFRKDYSTDYQPGGINDSERQYIHHMMSKIYDNAIEPNMELKTEPKKIELNSIISYN